MTVYSSSNQPITKKVCSNDASHTTKEWRKDPNDKTRDLCRNCYKTALAEKHKAEGVVCSNDATHTTKRWVKDPNDKTKTRDLCRNCYDAALAKKHTALAEKQKAEGVVCSNNASHTTKEWRKDPNDKTRDLCRNCYKTALAEKRKAEGKVCSNDATHTTKRWIKDPNDKAKTRDLCRKCYNTALAEKQKAEGRVCSNDATHTTKEWRKDPNDKTRDLCKNCYKTVLAEKHKAEGRVCSNDASHTTKEWVKDPNDKTRDLCKNCYNAAYPKKKSDRKRKREELNPGSSKDVASQSVSEPLPKRKRVEEGVPQVLSTSELSLVENQQPPAAEIIERAGPYGDIEDLFPPSIHDSSIFLTTNAPQTEFIGEIPDLEITESQSFQASAPPVRENRRFSADMGGNESDLFNYSGSQNDSSSIATTHAQLPETDYSYSYLLSDNFSSINQTSFNYLSDNNHDSL